MISITKKFEFEAAHQLVPEDVFGKCSNIHGHTYKLEIEICRHEIGSMEDGMIMNFTELKKIVNKNIIDEVDHRFLNDVNMFKDFSPSTAETMVAVFSNILMDKLPREITLLRVRLYETTNSYAEWKN